MALQDGNWHHIHSYTHERATRDDTVRLWQKISTEEDPAWTKRYHDPDPEMRAFGGRLEVTLNTGEIIIDELAVANAHPAGAKPFRREDYIQKFRTLTEGIVSKSESRRFLELIQNLPELSPDDVQKLNVQLENSQLDLSTQNSKGIF